MADRLWSRSWFFGLLLLIPALWLAFKSLEAVRQAAPAPVAMKDPLATGRSQMMESGPATLPADAPHPDPGLQPDQVVKIQLDAMRDNDKGGKNTGIAVAFNFASPENQRATGPLPHFIGMVKIGYTPMLSFKTAEYGKPLIQGNTAKQMVALTMADGAKVVYLFILERQTSGAAKNCWMTAGVSTLNQPLDADSKPNVI